MSKRTTTTIESYQLKNGDKRYRFKIYIGLDPLTGKEKRTTRSNFKTQKEAKHALSRIQFEIKNGTFQKKTPETYLDVIIFGISNMKRLLRTALLLKLVVSLKIISYLL